MTRTLKAAMIALALMLAVPAANADEMTFFGDFEDFFSDILYTSDDPPDPGSFILFDTPVLGIPKFDPSLGTLTDITITVEDFNPIFFDIGGDLSADQDDLMSEFMSEASVTGDAGLYVASGTGISSVITDFFDVFVVCGGDDFDFGCGGSEPASSGSDGTLFGETSIFGLVDPADFVGAGESVDALLVGMFIDASAMFINSNVSYSELDVFFDFFDGDSGLDDDVVAVTYTFTPVPLPASVLLLVPALAFVARARRRL